MNVVLNWDDISKPSIRSRLENKKNSLQFLPQCLEEISKSNTFVFKDKKMKVSYLVDIVHNLMLKYYFKRDNKFSLSSVIMKEKYGHLYNFYINYLIENKIILMVANYKKGTRTRVYALNESILRGKIKRYRNSDKTILKKYKNRTSQVEEGGIENSLIDGDIRTKLVNDLFHVQIEVDRAVFYLDSLKHENDNDIYNRNKYSVECIGDNHIFYHFDNYGRLHSNFTILKTFIRKNCLLIDGDKTCEIDIPNSQPLFLSKIISDSGTKWVSDDELSLFRYLTIEGKYYEYLMNSLGLNRKCAKELTYKVLFGRNGKNSKSDRLFSQLFPSIHNFIKLYKKEMGDYKILAYELQKAESNLIFNKIIRDIMTRYPEIKLVTVHDSIVTPIKYKDEVSAVFYSKLYEEFGII